MHCNFKFIVLCISLLLENGYSKKKEGDFCFIRSLNKNGVCLLISSCPSATELIRTRRIFPQTCGFKNTTPIVCCENNIVSNVTTTTPITPRDTQRPLAKETQTLLLEETQTTFLIKSQLGTTTAPTTNFESTSHSEETPQIGDKSRQKCKEYGDYVYVKPRIESVPGRDPPPRIAQCEMVQIENIVGGTPARLKEFPHMALVGFERNGTLYWKCGGSLISEKYVLSVAHCTFIERYGTPKHVLLGDLILNSETDKAQPQQISIKRSIAHPEYVRHERYNDIALLELEHNAVLNTYVRPACLNTNPNPQNTLSIASGWGNASILEKVVLDMFTNEECNYVYRNFRDFNLARGIVEETQICAGSRNESKDACYGDSGGPLQIINSNEVFCTHIILGIISFGRGCGMDNNPGVYTKVFPYIKWIEDNVWP